MDHNKAKQVLATRMRVAYDDLFTSDRNANAKTADQLKGWFKTKTGAGDAVAKKIATNFKSLATYADFTSPQADASPPGPADFADREDVSGDEDKRLDQVNAAANAAANARANSTSVNAKAHIGLVYRFEIHLPDTANVDTHRAIFKALREELM